MQWCMQRTRVGWRSAAYCLKVDKASESSYLNLGMVGNGTYINTGADQWEVEEEDRAVRKSRLDRLLDQVFLIIIICNVRASLMMMLLMMIKAMYRCFCRPSKLTATCLLPKWCLPSGSDSDLTLLWQLFFLLKILWQFFDIPLTMLWHFCDNSLTGIDISERWEPPWGWLYFMPRDWKPSFWSTSSSWPMCFSRSIYDTAFSRTIIHISSSTN